ncbi:MAG: STAS domain-containing protein [Leptospiraceae bacterium]|nr:STAS domain-containing protein [Leptospiraceae bacterium]MCB1199212.1 STAS domain-containing protein [Leptospiraceae bacterium]
MQLTEKEFPQGIIVYIQENRIDMSISRKFKEEIGKIIAKKPSILIMDFKETEYLDSSALGTLVTILRDTKSNGGEIRLVNLNQTLRTLLKLSKLETMFKIYDSLEEAVK